MITGDSKKKPTGAGEASGDWWDRWNTSDGSFPPEITHHRRSNTLLSFRPSNISWRNWSELHQRSIRVLHDHYFILPDTVLLSMSPFSGWTSDSCLFSQWDIYKVFEWLTPPPLCSSSASLKLFSDSLIICSLHLNFFFYLFPFLFLIYSYFVPVTHFLPSFFFPPPLTFWYPPSLPTLFSCPWRTLLPFCLVSSGSPPTRTGSVPWLSPLWQVCQVCVCAARW